MNNLLLNERSLIYHLRQYRSKRRLHYFAETESTNEVAKKLCGDGKGLGAFVVSDCQTAGKDYALSKAICEGIYEVDPSLILLGLSGSQMLKAAADTGLKCAKEVFADRAYEEDGSLVARTKPGAVITDEDEAIKRVIGMVKHGKVTAITGKEIAIEANSICVHGDGAKALEFVRKIRAALTIENIKIAPLCEIV